MIAASALLKMVGILERFIFAFGHGQHHQTQIFAQVIRGRAYQVADILDEKQIQFTHLPPLQSPLDHRGFQMANRAGGDLLHRYAAAREAVSVILCGQITNQRRNAICP